VTTQDAPSGAASGPRLARSGTALLLVGVPVALLLFALFQLCRHAWFGTNSPLGYQAFIPLGALALAWHRRQEVRKIITELAMLFPDPDHPKRRGNEWLAVIGALFLFFGVLTALPILGLFGFFLLVVGIVFCIWGPFVLRGLLGAVGYLLLMLLPPPVMSLMGLISINFHYRSVAFTGYVLRTFGRDLHIQGSTLSLSGQAPVDVPASFSGLEMLLPSLAFGVLIILWHRLSIWPSLLLLFTAGVLALAVNMLRILFLIQLQDARWLPALPFLLVVGALLWSLGIGLARRAAAQVRDE
jgi:exosortase/archaeosortase family protein